MGILSAASYPFRGLFLFILCMMPSLWSIIICPMLLCLAMMIVVVVALALSIPPQFAFCLMVASPIFAPFLVVVLFCIELIIICQLLFSACLSRAQDAVFDAVHVAQGGEWTVNHANDAIQARHSIGSAVYFALWRSFIMIITLPLNLVPYVGTVAYAAVCGYYLAWSLHFSWLQEFQNCETTTQQAAFVAERRGQYLIFGLICQLLDLVPILNILTFFSNSAAAALWAAEMDNEAERAMIGMVEEPLLEEAPSDGRV